MRSTSASSSSKKFEGSVCLDDHVNVGDDVSEADLAKVGCTFKRTPLTLNATVHVEIGSDSHSFWILVAYWSLVLQLSVLTGTN